MLMEAATTSRSALAGRAKRRVNTVRLPHSRHFPSSARVPRTECARKGKVAASLRLCWGRKPKGSGRLVEICALETSPEREEYLWMVNERLRNYMQPINLF